MTPPLGSTRAGLLTQIAGGVTASESDDKLLHRYYLGGDSPFADQIGDNDATNNGTTEITGDYVAGAARENTASNFIDLTALDDFGSNLGGGWAIALSVDNVASDAYVAGVELGATSIEIAIGTISVGGELNFRIENENNTAIILNSNGFDLSDGSAYRLVITTTDGTDASAYNLYVNQTESTVISSDADPTDNFSSFSDPVYTHTYNDGSANGFDNRLDGVIDDICVFGSGLTSAEATSYNNPWA